VDLPQVRRRVVDDYNVASASAPNSWSQEWHPHMRHQRKKDADAMSLKVSLQRPSDNGKACETGNSAKRAVERIDMERRKAETMEGVKHLTLSR
jgi:hypothetical protein